MAARKRAKKKAAKKKVGWGGRRAGAGRPEGSGSGPSPDSRKNRIALMFTDDELAVLKARAKKLKLPVATVAYDTIAASMARWK